MKKMMITAFLATALLSVATAFEAEVLFTKGKVEVQKNGAWVALEKGNALSKGDVIQTGFRSELELKIKETRVKVEPLSRLTIEQLAEKATKDDTRLYLDTGSLKANVKKTENRRVGFTVKSPVATASVRGTVISVTNTFQSTEVGTSVGSAAAWPSNNEEAEVATEEEDNAPESPVMEGNTPEDVSGGQAGAGSMLVREGQSADFSKDAHSTTPGEKAAQGSRELGGGTTTAATNEDVVMGGPADKGPAAGAPEIGVSGPASQTGRVIINVKFEN